MRPLEPDVLRFVRERFQPEAFDEAISVLHRDALSRPRVQRAVLYLSGGSLAMLEHYAALALRDLDQLLERAEYVLDVAEAPLRIRDFVKSPGDRTGSTASWRERAGPARAPGAPAARRFQIHADQLKGASFYLGMARYVVIGQPDEHLLLPCVRRSDNVMSLMHLPLMFVMEQICEHIDLADVGAEA
jgi:hypothetical protein